MELWTLKGAAKQPVVNIHKHIRIAVCVYKFVYNYKRNAETALKLLFFFSVQKNANNFLEKSINVCVPNQNSIEVWRFINMLIYVPFAINFSYLAIWDCFFDRSERKKSLAFVFHLLLLEIIKIRTQINPLTSGVYYNVVVMGMIFCRCCCFFFLLENWKYL